MLEDTVMEWYYLKVVLGVKPMKIFCQNVFTVLFTIDFVSVPGLNLNVNQGYTSHIFFIYISDYGNWNIAHQVSKNWPIYRNNTDQTYLRPRHRKWNYSQGKSTQLRFCPLGKFTCHDHSCVSIIGRCDGKVDCPRDRADEEECRRFSN